MFLLHGAGAKTGLKTSGCSSKGNTGKNACTTRCNRAGAAGFRVTCIIKSFFARRDDFSGDKGGLTPTPLTALAELCYSVNTNFPTPSAYFSHSSKAA